MPALPPSTETPPLVTADSRPVKELPDDPGGKDFPQKNKLTYDRLQNGDEPEADARPTTQAVGGAEPVAVASADDSLPDGGPREVKTMVVRPDGSLETPPIPAAPGPQEIASLQAPPLPAAPAPKPAAKPAKYVVQVGTKKNQTDALASFADMQQKYPTLLANYRPMVQKADLGAKGTWYRLRIGPIADKTTATKLCSQLKSQGLPDCLVMAQ